MCRLASFIVTREKVLWHHDSDRHEDIISYFKLKDDPRELVRVELAPEGTDYLTPMEKWKYKTDQDILSDWYNAKNAEDVVRDAILKWKKDRSWFFDAMEFVATIKAVKWFSNSGETSKNWKMFETRYAAWTASRDAARDAAGAAAGDAARNAAGAAELLALCIIVSDKIDEKYIQYAKNRWDVWVSGYGLLCDIDGTFYVYKKP